MLLNLIRNKASDLGGEEEVKLRLRDEEKECPESAGLGCVGAYGHQQTYLRLTLDA